MEEVYHYICVWNDDVPLYNYDLWTVNLLWKEGYSVFVKYSVIRYFSSVTRTFILVLETGRSLIKEVIWGDRLTVVVPFLYVRVFFWWMKLNSLNWDLASLERGIFHPSVLITTPDWPKGHIRNWGLWCPSRICLYDVHQPYFLLGRTNITRLGR